MSCRRYAANYDDDFFSSFFNRGTLKKMLRKFAFQLRSSYETKKGPLLAAQK